LDLLDYGLKGLDILIELGIGLALGLELELRFELVLELDLGLELGSEEKFGSSRLRSKKPKDSVKVKLGLVLGK
jgi:hypothetical protein